MRHPEFCFADTAFGGMEHRNHPMRIQEILDAIPENPIDCSCTWHRFPNGYLEHFEGNWKERNGKRYQSVGGYRGPSYADYVPIDIDVPGDLGTARKVAMEFFARLEVDFNVDASSGIRCWFSGSKGFHICLSAALFGYWPADALLAGRLRDLAVRLAGGIEIDAGIYDVNRLWRIPNTINSKSGLYKIPLTPAEVVSCSAADIAEMAREPRQMDWPAWDDTEVCPALLDLWKAVCAPKKQDKKNGKAVVSSSDMFRSDLQDGQGRDQHAFQIACRLRDWGVPPSGALTILDLWDRGLEQSLRDTDGEDIIEKKVQNAYGAVKDTESRISPDAVRSIAELAEDYGAYVKNLKANKISLGIPTLDRLMRGICPGEVCTVIAKTSTGKTLFAQNSLRNIARNGDASTFFASMEQPKAQVFERYAQIVTEDEGRYIESKWEEKSYREGVISSMMAELGDRMWTTDLPRLKMEEIEQLVRIAEERGGRKINVLVIDYMGLLDAKDLDRSLYGQISEAARQMKTLAKSLDVAVIVLCQISRAQDDHGNKPLHLSSARESGAIEESADFLLGLYRPYAGDEEHDDDTIRVQLLKNRKGHTGEVDCYFDRRTLRIGEAVHDSVPTVYMEENARRQGEREKEMAF